MKISITNAFIKKNRPIFSVSYQKGMSPTPVKKFLNCSREIILVNRYKKLTLSALCEKLWVRIPEKNVKITKFSDIESDNFGIVPFNTEIRLVIDGLDKKYWSI